MGLDDAPARSEPDAGSLDGLVEPGERREDPLAGLRGDATTAVAQSRWLALEYARRARGSIDGEVDRDALEALTFAVVDREG